MEILRKLPLLKLVNWAKVAAPMYNMHADLIFFPAGLNAWCQGTYLGMYTYLFQKWGICKIGLDR